MALPADAPVLVVDDDATLRRLFVTVLESAGLPAIEAPNGRSALEMIASRRVSTVLLDSRMPGMTGLDVLRQLRTRPASRTLPVIMVTAEDEIAQRVRALDAGADDYLTKPVHVDELIARVRAQLRGQAAWRRLLESRMQERTDLVNGLSRAHPAATAAGTADLICRHLIRLPDVSGAAVFAFNADAGVAPLALRGELTAFGRAGEPLPAARARQLRQHAQQGPWVADRGQDEISIPGIAPLRGPGEVACAPLHLHGQIIGLLAVSSSTDAADAASRSLALAIDVAAVGAAMLASTLGRSDEEASLHAAIQHVVRDEAFDIVFQPICALDDLRVVGYEALTRFVDGVAPHHRFTDAARVGLGADLEMTTMRAALVAARELPDALAVSLNVSPRLLTGDLALADMLATADRPVVLELTEHDPIEDYPTVRRAVEKLGQGVRLSVDDAGSGYACLTGVLALEPTFVKLDRGWVHGIDDDPARQALVAGLRHFAQDTGCQLIAEGIHSAPQLETLRALDVELGQGFLLGRPEPAATSGQARDGARPG